MKTNQMGWAELFSCIFLVYYYISYQLGLLEKLKPNTLSLPLSSQDEMKCCFKKNLDVPHSIEKKCPYFSRPPKAMACIAFQASALWSYHIVNWKYIFFFSIFTTIY